MNLVKTVNASDLLGIEQEINDFLVIYNGELIQFQVFKNESNGQYEAILSYKQSNPNNKDN